MLCCEKTSNIAVYWCRVSISLLTFAEEAEILVAWVRLDVFICLCNTIPFFWSKPMPLCCSDLHESRRLSANKRISKNHRLKWSYMRGYLASLECKKPFLGEFTAPRSLAGGEGAGCPSPRTSPLLSALGFGPLGSPLTTS